MKRCFMVRINVIRVRHLIWTNVAQPKSKPLDYFIGGRGT